MKILFTGSSSFTGFWFVKELVQAGHEVFAIFQGSSENYSGVRKERIKQISNICSVYFDCSFGSESFFSLVNSQNHWDCLCHHAACVTDYKSSDFDILRALHQNTFKLKGVLERLKEKQCSKVVLTGSIFEQDEGQGTLPLRAFSPYGLSKGLTSDVFAYYCEVHQFNLGKFVIPNPFGPYEDPRFTAYLMKNWLNHLPAQVETPAYIRDNIPVSLLAKSYVSFVNSLDSKPGFKRFAPSCYAESQGLFAQRFASHVQSRSNLACELILKPQTVFTEPEARVNTDQLDWKSLGWDESKSWDDLVRYYLQSQGVSS